MAKLNIFRAGTHTANSGQSIAFSGADLEATVKAYDPARHEAPLVVGHPRADAPAYGWVKSLAFSGGEVSAEPHQVDAAFQEMVNTGRFKKISASFYLPDAPNNPVPGVYYLRHVGFLGAQPPAVKGLKDARFADGEAGVIEFNEWNDRDIAELLQSLREWIIGKFGLEDADSALPGWEIDSVKERAIREAILEPLPESSPEALADAVSEAAAAIEAVKDEIDEIKGVNSPGYAEARKANAALTLMAADLAAREKRLEDQLREIKRNANLAFCEALLKEGRLAPGRVKSVAAFMSGLDDAAAVEFDEDHGNGAGRPAGVGGSVSGKGETPLSWFKKHLQSLPKQIEFSELKPEAAPSSADFTAAPGFTVDAAGLETHTKAEAYRKANPGTTYLEAVKAVE